MAMAWRLLLAVLKLGARTWVEASPCLGASKKPASLMINDGIFSIIDRGFKRQKTGLVNLCFGDFGHFQVIFGDLIPDN